LNLCYNSDQIDNNNNSYITDCSPIKVIDYCMFTDKDACLQCNDGYYLIEGNCVRTCPDDISQISAN
jgi:hypothetical protein